MPNVSLSIRKQLNVATFKLLNEETIDRVEPDYNSDDIKPTDYEHPIFHNHFVCFLKEGHKMGKSEPLFRRITEDEIKVLKEKFGGVQQQKKDEKTVAASETAAKIKKNPATAKTPKQPKTEESKPKVNLIFQIIK